MFKAVSDKLSVVFLPPYSPELNPDEFVWNDVKNNGVSRRLYHSNTGSQNSDRLQAPISPEKSTPYPFLFQAKTTRYAA